MDAAYRLCGAVDAYFGRIAPVLTRVFEMDDWHESRVGTPALQFTAHRKPREVKRDKL
jgi:hypothetical protein